MVVEERMWQAACVDEPRVERETTGCVFELLGEFEKNLYTSARALSIGRRCSLRWIVIMER